MISSLQAPIQDRVKPRSARPYRFRQWPQFRAQLTVEQEMDLNVHKSLLCERLVDPMLVKHSPDNIVDFKQLEIGTTLQ